MKNNIIAIIDNLFLRYPSLLTCKDSIESAFYILKKCYDNNGKMLSCGNGGSASDCDHIVGELMKGFKLKRKVKSALSNKLIEAFPDEGQYFSENLQGALPAISLVGQIAFTTAYTNDVSPEMVFAQQVFGYGKKGDVLIGLSTSGNSKNVINAFKIAKVFGINTICFTGKSGGIIGTLCDVAIRVPETDTFLVQEYHLPIYHAICAMLEEEYFG